VEDQVISLTAQIVSAHVATNDVAVDQLPGLIRNVHQALATAGQVSAEPVRAQPAVAAKKSVFADHILCLDCGQSFKMLKRHLSTDHQMTAGRIPSQVGPAAVIPNGRRRLCRDPIEAGEGQRFGSESSAAAAEAAWQAEEEWLVDRILTLGALFSPRR